MCVCVFHLLFPFYFITQPGVTFNILTNYLFVQIICFTDDDRTPICATKASTVITSPAPTDGSQCSSSCSTVVLNGGVPPSEHNQVVARTFEFSNEINVT